tara:strand:- start:309 stop:551 length:243 start_codon:yes stop_codon:yes gene_type:complete
MAVDKWVVEAIEINGGTGSTLLAIQSYIDEYHNEELALNTLKDCLTELTKAGRLMREDDRWYLKTKTNKEDALKMLFGDD